MPSDVCIVEETMLNHVDLLLYTRFINITFSTFWHRNRNIVIDISQNLRQMFVNESIQTGKEKRKIENKKKNWEIKWLHIDEQFFLSVIWIIYG